MYINTKLASLLKGNIKRISIITIYELLSSIFCCLTLVGWALLIRHGIEKNLKGILFSLAAILLFNVLHSIAEKHIVEVGAINGNAFKKNIRVKLFEKLFQLGPQYVDRKRCGEVVTTLWEKVEWLNFYYTEYFPKSISAIFFSILLVIILLFYDIAVGIALLVVSICLFCVPAVFCPIMKNSSQSEWAENDKFYSDCIDGIQGINTLKAFNANSKHRQKINAQAELMRKATMKNLILTTANSKALELFIVVGKYIPLLFAVSAFVVSSISMFDLLLIFFALQSWGNAAEKIMGSWLKGHKGIAGLDDIFEILNSECGYSLSGVNNTYNDKTLLNKNVKFENVTFSYSENVPVLKNISLEIKEGSETAIVGSSGSGKSTLAQLLFGFYKPQTGSITIGNMKMDSTNVCRLQSNITVIWQDSHIFNDTCFNNIKMAKPYASDADIYEAAKKANIHNLIMSLPEQYNTVIGNGGAALSGGERQRIIIARAFLRNSPILILDEATSSLDRQNEAEIQECIQELSEGKTVMVIAHRFETIGAADQICLLNHGSLIAKGTHEELMNNSEEYRILTELQNIRR